MKEITKGQFVKSTFWKIFERFVARGISLVTSVVLSRLLFPDDYGLIALTTVFTNLSEILIDAGFSTALIRKEKVDDDDYNCIFTISCVISAVLYIIFFVAAPFIATYYNEPKLTMILRIMSLVLFIQAFSSTRNAYVNRNMQFKLLMKCSTASSIISGIIGIGLAYLGLGVWALVLQRLLQQLILTIILFVKIKWKIKFSINLNKLKEMTKFSSGVIGASLINYMENCINSALIGKHYSIEELGYYDKGNMLPEQISLNSFGAMTNVLLPTISSYQNDLQKIKSIIRRINKYVIFLMFPVMLGLLMVSKEAVIILFSEKWISAIPLMKSICVYYIATPLMLIDIQVFFALGHSNIRVKTEIVRLILLVSGLIICCFLVQGSIDMLAITNASAVVIATLYTQYEVKKLIGYTFKERIFDSYKPFIASIIMCISIHFVSKCIEIYHLSIWIVLTVKIFVGISVYVVSAIILRCDIYKEILSLIKRKKNNG